MKGQIPVNLGTISVVLVGGPYKDKPADYFGIKMAEEINKVCEIDIPTRDYDVPSEAAMRLGLYRFIMAAASGQRKFYVGCYGGIGRTGLFMAALAKVMSEYWALEGRSDELLDPVEWVRDKYIPHAVETPEQQMYVDNLNVSDIVEWWEDTERKMYLTEMAPVGKTFWQKVKGFFGGNR